VALPTNLTIGSSGEVTNSNLVHGYLNNLNAASMNIKDNGATGDGTTDDAAAINAAASSAASLGARLSGTGTFKIGSTVTLTGDVDLSGATFNYTGTGTAIAVGTTGAYLMRKQVRLPKIVATAKTVTGWAQVAGSVGVAVINCYSFDISVPYVNNFETGLKIYGASSNGTSYCNVQLGHLDNNKRNLWFTADGTGWANQNYFYGGRLSHNSGEGTAVSGTRHVLMDTTTNKVNGNSFYGTSIESPNVVQYHIDCGGYDNYWFACRFENTGAPARVIWRANSTGNVIMYGFQATDMTETKEANTANHLWCRDGNRIVGAHATKAILQLENAYTADGAALKIMGAGAEGAGDDPATAWTATISSQSIRGKRPTDAYERVNLSGLYGRLYLGGGTATPAYYLEGGDSYGFLMTGNIGFNADNTYDIGASTLRPRYVRAGTAVQTGAAVTGSRPAASTAGVGAMFYDTTLSKPIWSNGTVWKDATGTTV
jgi:hypothetical protein